MRTETKLMDMLVGYAAAHQHPVNVAVHMIGIPCILFGVLVALSWVTIEVNAFRFTPAQVLVVGLFAFYFTLDIVFAVVFLVAGLAMTAAAGWVLQLPFASTATVAAVCFFGGYAAQFIGHAVEKSMPVLVRQPIQATLAAPFFTVVELFKLAGLRDGLFQRVRQEVAAKQGSAAVGS